MSRCRFILLIIVLAVLVTMVSFGAFQNQSPLNSGRYFTRNGGFVSEDAETEMIPIEDGLVYSVAIGVNKGMDNEKMATQKLFHKESGQSSLAPSSQNMAVPPHKKKPVSVPTIDKNRLFESNYPPPTINGYTCRSGLSLKSKMAQVSSINGPCHFMNGSSRSAVALASFPGSGNTWARGLLEKATGVCTGSKYTDSLLRERGFNGEGLMTGAVCVVKTHHTNKPVQWSKSPGSSGFGSAILIVRNPFDALVSEWTRETSQNHTGTTSLKSFGANRKWKTFVERESKRWGKYFRMWLVESHDHPTMMIRYEDLKVDIVSNVEKMLDFISFPYDHQELENHLTKDFTKFKRKHRNGVPTVDHFTTAQQDFVRSVIKQTLSYLRDNNHGNTLNIEEYLL
ncbi:WSCD family member AAEL009094-like isoform X2 [Halichondria panicea]|uniref:WSCD family member AAEL009094-like isoform X2 n=1 Tax=Halichondria panicea TaxID=6063 RepID=UPI00312BB491